MKRNRPEALDVACRQASHQVAAGLTFNNEELAKLLREAGEEIWCLRGVVKGVRIMARTGALAEWKDEPWLKCVMNIGLDH